MAEFFESYTIWILWIILSLFFLFLLVTAPCHAVLLLPLTGLPLFWLLPLGYALPINLATWLALAFRYRVIRRAMKKPINDGFQSLIGTEAEVVSRSETGRSAKYLIRARGELWSAYSTDTLQPGEPVNIVAVKGISVVVELVETGSGHGEISNAKPIVPGAGDNERHCH